MDHTLERAAALEPQIIDWRRDFHRHPELGFREFRTAGIVAEVLRGMGIEVTTGVGKTGVVGVIGDGGPVVGIRADMDALPIIEANAVSYASENAGVMHACGHDAHTAILLGVARMLTDMPDRPAGQIRLFFQPCEEAADDEGKSGAQRMMDEGIMNGVDRVIALHVASELPAGKIAIESGHTSAAVDNFFATIIGKGCHAASPHTGVDPIFILAQFINAFHGIRARRISPVRPMIATIGSVHGGIAENVIPNEVTLSGTLRSYDDETREGLWREVEMALGVARALGGDYALRIEKGCPSILNDIGVTDMIRTVATDIIGSDVLINDEPSMGGEDFSFMTRAAPGAMFLLGAKKDDVDRPHHNPLFDLDEGSFKVGAAVLAETTLRMLREAQN
ncbi:MAG: amidohydrolase [Chloroflexota bacterium]|nr:amidohydrolase [Chloroflexota bacterium]